MYVLGIALAVLPGLGSIKLVLKVSVIRVCSLVVIDPTNLSYHKAQVDDLSTTN